MLLYVSKSLYVLLSRTQAGPGRTVKQEQEEISRNHVPRLFLGSVRTTSTVYSFGIDNDNTDKSRLNAMSARAQAGRQQSEDRPTELIAC